MSMVNASEIGLRPLRAAFHSEASHRNGLEFRWRGAIEESSTTFILEWMEQRLSQLDTGALNKKRIKLILSNIRKKSLINKIDPKITNKIWKNMIWAYIDFEKRNFKKK